MTVMRKRRNKRNKPSGSLAPLGFSARKKPSQQRNKTVACYCFFSSPLRRETFLLLKQKCREPLMRLYFRISVTDVTPKDNDTEELHVVRLLKSRSAHTTGEPPCFDNCFDNCQFRLCITFRHIQRPWESG